MEERLISTRLLRALLLLVALVVRLGVLVYESQLPTFKVVGLDSRLYHDAGLLAQHGDWKLGTDVFHMSPGYSYFVGVVYLLLGAGSWPLRVVQVLLGVATVACVFGAARQVLGERWGLVAGALAALYGPFAFYDSQLLAESFATLLNAAFLWLLLAAAASGPRPIGRWVGAGLVLGLAIITRPNAALLGVGVAVAARLSGGTRRERLRALALTAVAAALVILPVTARNVIVAHEWLPVTDTRGMNLFIGNGPDANGTFRTPAGVQQASNPGDQFVIFKAVAEQNVGHALTAKAVDGYWFTLTWHHVVAHPLAWLRLMGEKLWLYWSERELPNAEDYTFDRNLNPVLGSPLVQFGWISPFALLGTVLFLSRRRRDELIVGSVNVVLCLANVVVFILARYRVSAVPGLIVAATGFLAWAVDEWQQRRWRSLAISGGVLAGVLALVWTPKLPTAPDDQYLKLGNTWLAQYGTAQAQEAYQRAVDSNPDNIAAQRSLALTSDAQEQPDRAREHWKEVLRLATAAGHLDDARDAAEHISREDKPAAPPIRR